MISKLYRKFRWMMFKRHCRKVYECYQDEPYWRDRYKAFGAIASGQFDELSNAVDEIKQLMRHA